MDDSLKSISQVEGEDEMLEGLDVEVSVGWGEYPLDSVFVRTEQRTVNEVVKRIKNDRYTSSNLKTVVFPHQCQDDF